MPAARRALPAKVDQDINEAIESLGRYHIVAVRRRRGGEITAVKHIAYGWMKAKDWYTLDEIHKWMPVISSVIQGGYQLKAWLWGTSIDVSADVLASGLNVSVPFGLFILGAALVEAADDFANGRTAQGYLDIAALALPFGELWTLFNGVLLLEEFITNPLGLLEGGKKGIGGVIYGGKPGGTRGSTP